MEKKFFYSAILVIAFIVLCGHKEEIKHPDREGASEEVSEIGAYSIFSASEGPKQIGQTHRAQMGDPSSNVFHFEIDTDPEKASTAWLSYCIKGLKNYASLTRNINHREAKGGYLIARDDGWNQQKEFLDPAWLKQGQNSIRISVPEDLVGQVFIQEVQLVLEWPEKADVLSGRSLFVDEHAVLQGNGRVYLNGFLTGPDKETAVICINDQTVQNWDGEFEEILVLEDFQVDSVSIVINAFYADGSSCTEEISVPQQSLQMPVDIRPFEERRRRTKAHIRPGVSRTLELGTAAIRLSSKSLTNATSLSITGLREVDLPSLPSNIINVTGESAGFRFLPHGMVFADDVQIVLPYNAGLIPKGYSSNDVQSFFFDDESQSWQALQRDSLLDYPAKIVSRSNHFTDFIAGIIKVPESPETQSFIKTSLSDIKAANPGEGIHQMEMPEATHLGQVNLSYPLNLPLGRKGLGPELRVTYNSDGANSWMGMGWNLAVPAISTETRWGVPLYLPAKESETYLLNGEKLSPQAHRLPNFESRTSEKQFYLRVEGSFQKIIRHGSSPKNYWWEVTDKAGRRSFFGGRPGVGVVENAVLKDLQGNIAHWGMVEVRDLHQNFIRYHWAVKLDQGTPLSPNIGKDLYLQKITYTGHQQTEGAYEVKLIRDDQLGESKRKDVSISCLLGLKRVSASLLRKVEIRFKGKMIRSYAFNYTEGAFYKTLLSSLIEYDQAGKEFTRHEMEYLDEVRNGGIYRPYFSRQRWNIPDDDLNGNFINPINGFRDNVSALHGSKSKNRGSSFSITFGRGWNLTSKRSSIGGNFSFDTSIGEGLLALVDINGDKLPDKVFIENGRIYYRSNSGQDIGAKKLIYGLSQFSSSKSKSRGLGFEVHPFPFTISRGKNVTESITETFFADFNSDGYIDIAYKGLVFFGYRNSQGEIAFTRFSDLTPNPVQSGAPLDPILAPNDSLIQEEMIDNFPLHDMVRMWEAPRDGVIKINAPVQLIQDTSQIAQADTLRDGVRVAIQHKGTELWSKIIGPDDHLLKVPVGVNTVPVEQGDRIYFRVQSIQNGSSDQVIWDPEITYANISVNEKDAQNHAVYRYKASEDFVNTSCQSLYLPYDGIVKIEGSFNKGFLSDEIDVEILRRDSQGNDSLILKSNFPNDTIINNLNLSFTVPFGKDDEVFFRVKSQTNVDWGNITWTPRVYYTLAQDSLGNAIQVVENGTYLIDYCPAVDFSMYNHLVQPSEVFMPNSDHNLVIYPSFGFLNYPFPQTPEWESGTVTLSLKGINKTYQKVVYDITNNTVVGLPGSLIFPVKKDSIYFVELHFSSYALLKQADTLQLSGNYYGPYGIHSVLPGEKLILGPYHRGWGHFVYNGNRGRADSAIQEHLLVPDPNLENPQDISTINGPDDVQEFYDPTKAIVTTLISFPKSKSWRGFDDLTFITPDTLSSSRLGQDDIILPGLANIQALNFTLNTIQKISRTKSTGNSFKAAALIGSPSSSTSTTETVLDLLDLNGDGYLDILTSKAIQFTNSNGGLSNRVLQHNFGNHRAKASSTGITLGTGGAVGVIMAETSNSGAPANASGNSQAIDKSNQQLAGHQKVANAIMNAAKSLSISGNVNTSTDEVEFTWMDINGDNLPDKVYKNGEVAMSYGKGFFPKEKWDFTFIRKGSNEASGAGLGTSLGGGSYFIGIGLSKTISKTGVALFDLNGDGLMDIVRAGNPFIVKFNTGNGFGPDIPWPGPTEFDKGTSTGESANAGFTICFPIPLFFITLKVCFNPSVSVGRGVSRQNTQFVDIDGDGFLDFLESNDDGELYVRSSTIGKTNLLKKVSRPMGTSFTLTYDRLGNTPDLPQSKYVLSSTSLYDGVPGDGVDSTKKVFKYEGGYYDRREREFYGFAKVHTQQVDVSQGDLVLRKEINEFYNRDYYRKGLLQSSRLEDGQGNSYQETHFTYLPKDIKTGLSLSDITLASFNGSVFTGMIKKVNSYFEGQPSPGLQTTEEYQFDSIGNVIVFTDYGDGSAEDQRQAFISYHDFPNQYLKSIPQSVQVYDFQGLIRKRESQVDHRGNVLQIGQYVNDSIMAFVDMEYDGFGNMTKYIKPINHKGERMWYELTYDAEIATYPIQVSDAYGYTSSSTYDFLYGQKLSETDINHSVIEYELDDQGRTTIIRGPFELASNKEYTLKFSYFPDAAVPFAVTNHYEPETEGDLETHTFTDGLQRVLQIKKTGSVFSSEEQADEKKIIVSGRQTFDALGRAFKIHHPILEDPGNETVFNPNIDSVSPLVKKFDILDREVEVTLADGAKSIMEYGFAPDNLGIIHFQTISTDPLGNQREVFSDVRGRKRATNDHGPDGFIWTNYFYNALSEWVRVVDTNGDTTSFEYDMLGRQTARKHPDANLTEFVYDLAGNPTKKITANIRTQIPDGGAILYTYDKERLVQIDYPRNYQNQVRFHYGGADAQYGRVGRVWLTEDASGGEEVYYDELGQVSKQVRTLVISPEKQLTYVSEFVYDTWGRIQQMIYPDGEVVDYEYSGAGKLIAVSSQKEGERYDIVRRLGYDKFEERIYMEFGNGTKTSYVYQPERRRLKQLEVFTPGAGGRTIMDYRYQYDAVDNILSVQNSVSIPSVFQLGGPTQHHFEYDELYRLTKALGSWKGKNDARSYQLEMIYNNQHNILQKDQVHLRQGQDTVGKNTYRNTYLYEGNQPHAPSQVGVKKMHYDANGNLIRWEIPKLFHKREIQWDEENRIQGIIDNGALSKFTYNAAGERAIKSHGGLQAAFYNGETSGFQRHSSNWTAYVSPYLVATNKGFTKHYFIEGQRIQAKIGKGEFKNQFSLLAPNTAGGINYGAKLAEQEAQAGAYYDSLYRLTAFPEIIAVKGQPAFTGRPIPPLNPQAHYELPQAWQDLWRARTNQDPPGLPALGDPVNDNSNLKAGFNYQPDSVSLESDLYFLHGDHLGSASFITDASGLVTQHIGYLPFGETFYEEHNARLAHSYLFNGKELDRETGLYYSGARYVDPESSLWLGVDPLADIMSNWSPYCYTFNNPVNFTDPTGKIPSPTEGAAMSDHIYTGKAGEEVVGGWTLDRVLSSESDPGYRAGVYVRERNGIKEYAMANAGTEFSITKKSGRDDLVENIEQPFGGSEHMKLSISHAKELSREVGNAELTFVGHSKGGAEAAGNALATNRNALLYNPAAINPNAYGLDSKLYTGADEHGMTAFIVKGDALNRYLNSWSARPIDKAVYLNRQSLSSVKNHSIKSVINALKNHSP